MYKVNRFTGVFPAPKEKKYIIWLGVYSLYCKTVYRKITARNVFLLHCLCGLHAETNIQQESVSRTNDQLVIFSESKTYTATSEFWFPKWMTLINQIFLVTLKHTAYLGNPESQNNDSYDPVYNTR